MSWANFTIFWKVDWFEFGDLSSKSIMKDFTTAHENVSFDWRITLGRLNSSSEGWFGLILNYVDGVLPTLKDISFVITVKRGPGNSVPVIDSGKYEATRVSEWDRPDFDLLSAADFRNKYGMTNLDPITYTITVKIPVSAFSYSPKYDPPKIPSWISDMQKYLEDEEKSEDSDVRLVSNDGTIFYAHRIVLRRQSEGLAGIFRHPTTEEEKAGIFRFPKSSSQVFRVALECLYKGDVPLGHLSTDTLLEVADFAEQYQLKNLKEICSVCLWERIAEKPEDAGDLLRFADVYGLKHLKDRTMNIMRENFDKLGVNAVDFWKIGEEEDEQGKRLREEFTLFLFHRVGAYLSMQ